MGRKDAVLRLRLDAELVGRLDALKRRIQRTHRYAVLERLGEKPGLLSRSKVARAALVRGLEALTAELEEEDGRYDASRQAWRLEREGLGAKGKPRKPG